jgi:hypothetical protein
VGAVSAVALALAGALDITLVELAAAVEAEG